MSDNESLSACWESAMSDNESLSACWESAMSDNEPLSACWESAMSGCGTASGIVALPLAYKRDQSAKHSVIANGFKRPFFFILEDCDIWDGRLALALAPTLSRRRNGIYWDINVVRFNKFINTIRK